MIEFMKSLFIKGEKRGSFVTSYLYIGRMVCLERIMQKAALKGGDAYGKIPKESSNVIAMNGTLSPSCEPKAWQSAMGRCKQFQGGFTEGKEGALARGTNVVRGFSLVHDPEGSHYKNGQPVMRQA